MTSTTSPDLSTTTLTPQSERLVILLISAIQFVNVLEFMMVMPLGPDFATALGIPSSRLGFIGGAYTAAASVSGIVASTFVERFDRRTAVGAAMAGLVLATVFGGLAQSFEALIAARVVAGIFGGPATAIALAVVADVIPPQRRGRAMGIVMGSFSIASVFGVPAGLELARLGGWRTPFFAVAAMALAIAAVVFRKLPPLRFHMQRAGGAPRAPLRTLLRRPLVLQAYVLTAFLMMGNFMLLPNLATYVQFNLGYPRAKLSLLYMFAGVASFITMRIAGPLVDRFGAFRVGTGGTVVLLMMMYFGFVEPHRWLTPMAIYAAFMVATSLRNVPFQTLTSRVPAATERASYMSLGASINHMAAALGAFLGSQMLTERADHSLDGVVEMTLVAMALGAVMPFCLWLVERGVKRQEAAAGPGLMRPDPAILAGESA